jgi:uncharacterized membrane protein
MTLLETLAAMPPSVAVHVASATLALLLGPLALGIRKRSPGHRGAGYLWIAAMLVAAVSSLFIRDFRLPNLAGYTPIHLLTAAAFIGIGLGLWHISRRNIVRHRLAMRITYASLVVAGVMSFLPQRALGGFAWQQVLA